MRLEELASGSKVLIDANIFIYHFSGLSNSCTHLLQRCEQGELVGYTTVHILLEVMHRLMMLEAVTKGLIAPGNIAKKLKENPQIVMQLSDYRDNTLKIPEMGISIFPITLELCHDAVSLQERYGMLPNDSLILAACYAYSCHNLASNDLAFTKVEDLVLFTPEDLSTTID